MRILVMITLGIFVIALPLCAAAQTDTTEPTVAGELELEIERMSSDPGVLPDNPLFVAKRWWEDVRLFFTFNPANKAELEQKLALKRIVEAEKLIESGKIDMAERHLGRYQKHLENFEERMAAIQEKDTEKAAAMLQRFEQIQERQQETLQRVYDQVPEQARDGVLNAIERSASGIESAIRRFQSDSEEKVDEYRNEVKNRIENEKEDIQMEIREQLQERGVIDDEDDSRGNGTQSNTNVAEDQSDDDSNENVNDDENDESDAHANSAEDEAEDGDEDDS